MSVDAPPGGAFRGGLPYGAVMATAGASALAGRCGFEVLVTPLLVLAVVQALWVPLVGTWHRRHGWGASCRAWCAIGPAHEHAGIHTVPLGWAVIAGGLATWAASNQEGWLWNLAWAGFGLTWLLTLVCVGRFAWSLSRRPVLLRNVGGAWFLVPATLLGAGIATDAVARMASGHAVAVLQTLALVAVLCGWLGYWAMAGAALMRARRHGLAGVPQAPWWIAMGCAGLAAAALGRVVQAGVAAIWLQAWLRDALVVTMVVAIVLCVPVIAGSVAFLRHRCQYRAPAAWPPTFSTAVFALGCLESGAVLSVPLLLELGLAAGYATLVFWAVTMAWNTRCTLIAAVSRSGM